MFKNDRMVRDTPAQLMVAGWLQDMGMGFSLEAEEFYPYTVDIYVSDLNLAIELDGPSHMKKKNQKRDDHIKEHHEVDTWRFKNEEIRTSFKDEFTEMIDSRAEEVAKDAEAERRTEG